MKFTYINLFSNKVWQSISEQTKKRALKWIADCIAENLGLKHRPNLKYINLPPAADDGGHTVQLGVYSAQKNTIYINIQFISDSYGIVETIAHELRHAWQNQVSKTRDSKQSIIMANNFMNYVSINDSAKYYNYQPLERDARKYASEVRATVESLSQIL